MLKFPAIKNIVIKAEFAGEGTFFANRFSSLGSFVIKTMMKSVFQVFLVFSKL